MLSHSKSKWLLSLGQVIDFVSSVDFNFSIVLKKTVVLVELGLPLIERNNLILLTELVV